MSERVIFGNERAYSPYTPQEVVIPPFLVNNHYKQYAPCISPVDGSLLLAKVDFSSTASFNVNDWIVISGGGGGGGATLASIGAAAALTPTAVKTANYTAAAGDFVPFDLTSGNLVLTLPNAPADGQRVGTKIITQPGTNTLTINCGGADVINKAGTTSGSLILLNQGTQFVYKSGIWYASATDLPLSQLDLRYEKRVVFGTQAAQPTAATFGVGFYFITDPSILQLQYSNGTTWTAVSPSAVAASQPIGSRVAIARLTANFTTTSTTDVDIPGLAITWTAIAGATYAVELFSAIGNTVAGDGASLSLCDTANTVLETGGYTSPTANASGQPWLLNEVSPAAGSVTYKARLHAVTGGTGFSLNGSNFRACIRATRVA